MPIYNRMSDEFDPQFWFSPGEPFLLEWDDAKKNIVIRSNTAGPPFARSPNLRRDKLDDFRIPIVKRTLTRTNMPAYDMRQACVERAEIHANDRVRLAFERQMEQTINELPER